MSISHPDRNRRHRIPAFAKSAVLSNAIVVILAAAGGAASAPAVSQSSQRSGQAALQIVDSKDLLWWLPADTESVVVARGPFGIPAGSNENSEKNEKEWFTKAASATDIHEELESLPLEVTCDLDFDFSKALRGYTVAIAMQGSRHFREPRGEAEVTDFEGSSIVVFDKDLGGWEGNFGRSLSRKATRTETINEIRVLIFSQKSLGAEWTDFVALPRPNVLLVANNRNYFQEVLDQMRQHKSPRALPDQLPEWRFLGANARFWGLRHYDPTQAKLDPTSPLGDDQTFTPSDKKAIGVLFAVDPRNERSAEMVIFSGDEAGINDEARAGSVAAEPQEGVSFKVKLRNPEPGVLVQSYTLDKSSTLDYFILAVESALGRGMYL